MMVWTNTEDIFGNIGAVLPEWLNVMGFRVGKPIFQFDYITTDLTFISTYSFD